MRAKRKPLTHIEVLRRLAHSGLAGSPEVDRPVGNMEGMTTLRERVDFLLGVAAKTQTKPTEMLFFVMYDIESDKVRREVAKYLLDKGCFRIQRSIFLASLDRSVFAQIKSDLAEVQSLYDNNDSIIVCPVATDEIRAMRVIGKSVDIDVITRARNTLFF